MTMTPSQWAMEQAEEIWETFWTDRDLSSGECIELIALALDAAVTEERKAILKLREFTERPTLTDEYGKGYYSACDMIVAAIRARGR